MTQEDKTIEPTSPHMTNPADRADPNLVDHFLRIILQSLEDDKAEQIVTIALAGKTSIADHMVIASGRSSRQVAAMAEHLARRLKDAGAGAARLEGLPHADWVLIDAKDIIVHLFRPEVRCFYKLEKMWGANTLVEPPAEVTIEEEGGAARDAMPLDPGDEA